MTNAATNPENPINEEALHTLVGGVLQDLGGAFSVPLVQIGEALGLYRALDEKGPQTSGELSRSTGLDERYLREWLSAQAASNYITYDATSGRFSMIRFGGGLPTQYASGERCFSNR